MSDVVVYRKRRGVELSMLVFALALPFAGYLLTEINLHGQLPALLIPAALVWTGIGLAA
ncbi:MAG TPA: cell division protein, partial [Propionibacteriaceae bacterium]|nr:cell division protein [Propionibacteriaceae bacterium]